MIIGAKTRLAKLAMAVLAPALAVASMPGVARADARSLYYERAFIAAADARCGLFETPVRAALASATAQARGAALRAGVEADTLNIAAGRARARAGATPCASADLDLVAGRVRHAFEGWSRTAVMTFPGEDNQWRVDRTAFARPTWRMVQHSAYRDAPISVGYAAGPGLEAGLMAVVSFPGRPRPYAARIVTRDPARAQRPWIVTASLAPGAVSALPPESARRGVFSTTRLLAPEGLLAEGRRSGLVWRFPDAAADAIAALDPRETFTVEFLFHDDSTAVARFEAGDFVAARAFLAMGER